MLELNKLCYSYTSKKGSNEALRNISFKVSVGETASIIGKSGSGKSTLLSILGGLLSPTGGKYTFDDKDISQFNSRELADFRGGDIGFVFQDFFLLPHLTVLENVLLPLEHSRKKIVDGYKYANELLTKVGLSGFEDRLPNEISGGQAQRVAIARALINKPRVILADEPTGNLDPESTANIISILEELAKQQITIIVVTHDIDVASRFNKQIHIKEGTLV